MKLADVDQAYHTRGHLKQAEEALAKHRDLVSAESLQSKDITRVGIQVQVGSGMSYVSVDLDDPILKQIENRLEINVREKRELLRRLGVEVP